MSSGQERYRACRPAPPTTFSGGTGVTAVEERVALLEPLTHQNIKTLAFPFPILSSWFTTSTSLNGSPSSGHSRAPPLDISAHSSSNSSSMAPPPSSAPGLRLLTGRRLLPSKSRREVGLHGQQQRFKRDGLNLPPPRREGGLASKDSLPLIRLDISYEGKATPTAGCSRHRRSGLMTAEEQRAYPTGASPAVDETMPVASGPSCVRRSVRGHYRQMQRTEYQIYCNITPPQHDAR